MDKLYLPLIVIYNDTIASCGEIEGKFQIKICEIKWRGEIE
jgi:hypothetical protein